MNIEKRAPIVGEPGATTLRSALVDVGEFVSYLKAEVGPVPSVAPMSTAVEDGIWISCKDLVDDPQWLGRVIEGTGRAIGTDDQVVAASIFVQGYAYRLLALAVACLTVGGRVPASEPPRMAIGLGRGRASKVAYVDPGVFEVTDGARVAESLSDPSLLDEALQLILDQVIELHLRPLIASVRADMTIGERLLWGNVAASASTAFRTMEGCRGAWVIPLGLRFFELLPPELQGLGSFLLLEEDGKRGWYWERTNCCLFDRIQGQPRCSDCSRTPVEERRAGYRKSLLG
jgi:ferric iron reductase protein FhuF